MLGAARRGHVARSCPGFRHNRVIDHVLAECGQREIRGAPTVERRGHFLRSEAGVYSVFMDGRGIYRERNGWGTQHSVRVKYDEHQELDISEDRYRARGYQPPFDQLPWKDESANDNA